MFLWFIILLAVDWLDLIKCNLYYSLGVDPQLLNNLIRNLNNVEERATAQQARVAEMDQALAYQGRKPCGCRSRASCISCDHRGGRARVTRVGYHRST